MSCPVSVGTRVCHARHHRDLVVAQAAVDDFGDGGSLAVLVGISIQAFLKQDRLVENVRAETRVFLGDLEF